MNILASYAIEDIRRIGDSREDYYEDIDMMLEVGDQIVLKDIPVNLRASNIMSKSSYNHSLNYSSATGNIENLLTLLAHTYGRGKTPELQVCATRGRGSGRGRGTIRNYRGTYDGRSTLSEWGRLTK